MALEHPSEADVMEVAAGVPPPAKVHGGSSVPRQGQDRASVQEEVGQEDAPCLEKHGHTSTWDLS